MEKDKITNGSNKRKTLQDKLKEALAKKPTASFLNNNLNKIKDQLSTQKRIIRNSKRIKKFTRPNKIQVNHNELLEPPGNYGLSFEYPTPEWFRNTSEVDVSIIVPLYKSKSVVKDLINSYKEDEELKIEIIFIDDCCPEDSKLDVIDHFNAIKNKFKNKIGKIICNHKNKGYGQSCNAGVDFASGKYIIMLNADTKLTDNWIKPMVDLFDDPSVGIVGNIQLKEGGSLNGTIDSAGSEWLWQDNNFLHIGRHTHNKSHLKRPFDLENCPKDLLEVSEREMVTGCCFAIKKDLFKYIGGFNPNYKIGYWEDSEICLNVRELGYKILLQPNSVIWHKLGHTSSGGHKYFSRNKQYFFNKWVNSYRIDRLLFDQGRLKEQDAPETILIKRTNAHGDVLIAAGVCSALKNRYKKSKIIFCTLFPETLEKHPYIDKVIKPEEIKTIKHDLFYNLDLCYEWRPNVNILTAYAESVGENTVNCEVVVHKSPIKIDLPEKFIVIHAGKTDWAGRDWPTERFEEVSKYLMNKGHKIVTVGKYTERAISCDLDLRGKTTIQELAYVISKSSFFIGIDSFPMHIAQAVNANGVCFFGSVLPELRIYSKNMHGINANNLPCIGCHHKKPAPSTVTRTCETLNFDCIKNVSIYNMINKIESLINAPI